jgi:hypothetical protein
MENDKAIAYQRKIEALYANEAEAKFKKEHWPADPFDTGIMLDASYLDVADLAAIYKAGKILRDEGNDFLSHGLIRFKRSQDEKWEPAVKVNPLYLDARRQRTIEISELLYNFYWGKCCAFAQKRQEILNMGDIQLVEMVRQIEEALGLTAAELEVIVDAK